MLRRRAGGAAVPPAIPEFRRLWLADVISLLGDWAGRLALTVLVLERTGSPGVGGGGHRRVAGRLRRHRPGAGHPRRPLRAGQRDARGRRRPGAAVRRHAAVDAGGSAARAGLPRRPGHPAVRGGPLCGHARPRAGGALHRRAGAGRHLRAVVARDRLRPRRCSCSPSSTPRSALAINALSFLVSGRRCSPGLRDTPAAHPAAVPHTVGGSLRDGAAALFRDRMVRRALAIVAVTGALGTVGEALVVPYASDIGLRRRHARAAGRRRPGRHAPRHRRHRQRHARPPHAAAQRGAVRHRHGRRGRARCSGWRCRGAARLPRLPHRRRHVRGVDPHQHRHRPAPRAATPGPRRWASPWACSWARRPWAPRSAVSWPPSSASPQAIAGALAAATVFGVWAVATTPTEPKHLVRPDRPLRAAAVIDLPALEAEQAPAPVG